MPTTTDDTTDTPATGETPTGTAAHAELDALTAEIARSRYDWADLAACDGEPIEWFYPDRGRNVDQAKALCQSCPVKGTCLDAALAANEQYGVWGGMTIAERRREAKRRQAAAEHDQGDEPAVPAPREPAVVAA